MTLKISTGAGTVWAVARIFLATVGLSCYASVRKLQHVNTPQKSQTAGANWILG